MVPLDTTFRNPERREGIHVPHCESNKEWTLVSEPRWIEGRQGSKPPHERGADDISLEKQGWDWVERRGKKAVQGDRQ